MKFPQGHPIHKVEIRCFANLNGKESFFQVYTKIMKSAMAITEYIKLWMSTETRDSLTTP